MNKNIVIYALILALILLFFFLVNNVLIPYMNNTSNKLPMFNMT